MREKTLVTAIAIALIAVGIIYKIVAHKTKRGRRQREQLNDGN